MTALFIAALALVGVVAAGIAAVTGFGIGSLLTPVLALAVGTKLAVAAISIPHLVGSAQRFWLLRRHVDRRVLLRFGIASAVGGLAGALGGMVGNQGGIRTAALLGFEVPKESFVATATAIALFVDGARMPVYLATEWREIARIWLLILAATIGVVAGTMLGTRVLGRLRQDAFRRVIGVLLVLLGVYMAVAGRG